MTSTITRSLHHSGHRSITQVLPNPARRSFLDTVRHISTSSRSLRNERPYIKAMAPKRGKFAKPSKAPPIQRTHFVCLPLTTGDSISQLKGSLTQFRQVTSLPEDTAPIERTSLVGGDADQNLSSSSPPSLRQIPHAAYRPPGTFHLTLGVMDLSSHDDMDRALKLLGDINYVDLLREAETTSSQDPLVTDGKSQQKRPSGKSRMQVTHQLSSSSSASVTPEGIQASLKSLDRAISPPAPKPKTSSTPTEPSFTTSHDTPVDPVPIERHPQPQPLTLTLHGLGTFPSASTARVFFAHAHDGSRRLQRFAELVRQRFQSAGLITETRPLVLHATMANMIYVKRPRGRDVSGAKAPVGVDGREILRFFNTVGEAARGGQAEVGTWSHTPVNPASMASSALPVPEGYIWARDITVNRVRICKMGAEPCDVPGWGLEYKPIAEQFIISSEQNSGQVGTEYADV